ncbi:hypothetical protein LPTSP3_g21070 [Leptospira kobayashii]|uniref:Uncharacterized protein n=1 Tax=Leptospira kobayashii TaxID=1917830 RepID=A0ABN6KDU0_9LEPT|nr:hypothetical protein LPTSP3_g21070 [Leptospira kobayashii]
MILYQSLTQQEVGIFHGENVSYDTYLLGEDTLFRKVFNIYKNDTFYRGREIGNIFNYLDIKFIELSYNSGHLTFLSVVHYSVLTIAFLGVLFFPLGGVAREKKRVILLLLFFIFLLSPTIFVSGILHFRTSKIIVCFLIFVLMFLFFETRLGFVLKNKWFLFTLFAFLSLVDEQGYFVLLFLVISSLGYYIYSNKKRFFTVFYIGLAAILFRQIYYYLIGPYIYESLTGKEVDFDSTANLVSSVIVRIWTSTFYVSSLHQSVMNVRSFFGFEAENAGSIVTGVAFCFLLAIDISDWKNRYRHLYYLNLFNPYSYRSVSFLISVFAFGVMTFLIGSPINGFYYSIPLAGIVFVLSVYVLLYASRKQGYLFLPVSLFLGGILFTVYAGTFTHKLSRFNVDIAMYERETVTLKACLENPEKPISEFPFKNPRFEWNYDHEIMMGNFSHLCKFLRRRHLIDKADQLH